MTQTSKINRRRFDRFSFEHTFVVECENFQGISNTSSKDVSSNGAHLVSQTPLEKGSIVSIEIPSEKLQVMGEVCWVGEKTTGGYDIGVSFHEFFPATKSKIANLIERIQIEPQNKIEGPHFSFELEQNVSTFLDRYIEALRPEALSQAPISYRRLGTPTEKTISFYTPSRPQTLEGTTTSFRIDEQQTAREFPIRAMVLGLLAISLLFFRSTFVEHLSARFAPQTPATPKIITKTAPAKAELVTAHGIESDSMTFPDGLVEKIEWSGTTDRLQVKYSFRSKVEPTQVQVSKINFDNQPRQLIKIGGVSGKLELQPIMVGHSLVNQIRMGMHQDGLHIVMDMTSRNVSASAVAQDSQSLTMELQYSSN